MNLSARKKMLSLTGSFLASMLLCLSLIGTASVQADSTAVQPEQELLAASVQEQRDQREERLLVPGGTAFGVKVYASGVMVVGLSEIETAEGVKNPAYAAGIRVKDVITAIDGEPVNTVEQVSAILESCNGDPVSVTLERKGVEVDTSFCPVLDVNNRYKAGLWVRDSTAGIGTLTFYDPQTGQFGGLGHAICDVDTGDVVPIDSGTVVGARVIDVRRGQRGTAGELVGVFEESSTIGRLYQNCEVGVFGVADEAFALQGQAIPIATRQEIREGRATMICSASGEPREYEILITKVMAASGNSAKSMSIQITDPALIELTGGIVQGMSGSPILQNGKLVGAVTHVMLGDPTKGYGIFIETMLEQLAVDS